MLGSSELGDNAHDDDRTSPSRTYLTVRSIRWLSFQVLDLESKQIAEVDSDDGRGGDEGSSRGGTGLDVSEWSYGDLNNDGKDSLSRSNGPFGRSV